MQSDAIGLWPVAGVPVASEPVGLRAGVPERLSPRVPEGSGAQIQKVPMPVAS